jgi:hypothetical protein
MTSFLVKHGQIWSNMVKSGQTWSEKMVKKENYVFMAEKGLCT